MWVLAGFGWSSQEGCGNPIREALDGACSLRNAHDNVLEVDGDMVEIDGGLDEAHEVSSQHHFENY